VGYPGSKIPQGLRQELTLVRKKYGLWTGTDQMSKTNWNYQNWNEAGSHSPLGRGSSLCDLIPMRFHINFDLQFVTIAAYNWSRETLYYHPHLQPL
jgi:hypothetical protein